LTEVAENISWNPANKGQKLDLVWKIENKLAKLSGPLPNVLPLIHFMPIRLSVCPTQSVRLECWIKSNQGRLRDWLLWDKVNTLSNVNPQYYFFKIRQTDSL
jgi:hypothetical protein